MNLEDNLYKFLGHYKAAPAPLRRAAAAVYGRIPARAKYGRARDVHADTIARAKTWPRARVEAYQLEQVNGLVAHARARTDHYAETLAGVAEPFESLDAFREAVPFVTKDQLRAGADRFRDRTADARDLMEISTGGTTGEPLKLYYQKGVTRTKEWAYMHDLWSRVGYSPGDRRAVFRSTLVRGRAADALWEHDPIKNRYFFSSYDLTEENVALYIDKLREIRPAYLHVYPSVLTLIASYMKARGLPPIDGVRGILSGSENTFPHQIELFESVFQCRVMRWYGLGEMSALAGATEHDTGYHVYPTYSYVELVDEAGAPVTAVGARGEIVGTTFHNTAMPLLRYRTGDYAIYAGRDRSGALVFSEIEGRAQEFVVDREGTVLSLGPFIFGIHDAFWHNVSGVQFVQEEAGRLVVRGCSSTLPAAELAAYLDRTFAPRFEGRFEYAVEVVDGFERTRAGKHRYLIQSLRLPDRGVQA